MNQLTFSQEDLRRILERGPDQPTVFLESACGLKKQAVSYLFSGFSAVLAFYPQDDIRSFFRRLEKFLANGYWICGYFSYEFGYFLDDVFSGLRPKTGSQPIAWIGVCKKPRIFQGRPVSRRTENIISRPLDITPSLDERTYTDRLAKIKQYLKDGLTYQVNFTFKMKFTYERGPLELYLRLRSAQPTPYMAFINTGFHHVISLSPELFFRRQGRLIEVKPMKGTAPRGAGPRQEKAILAEFKRQKKIRAENLMIVDLMRNDLGRIGKKVWVKKLFEVEKHATLFQMTSTVKARLKDKAGWQEIFAGLFPSGSVTGAPKIKTMELIRDLEASQRGIYTGSIGYIAPDARACFNVAIRTAVLENGQGQMGVGGGIVYDSEPRAEYKEALLKAKFLGQDPVLENACRY